MVVLALLAGSTAACSGSCRRSRSGRRRAMLTEPVAALLPGDHPLSGRAELELA
jgi:hypothetical protein